MLREVPDDPPHHGAHLGVLAEPGAVKGWPGAPSGPSAGVQLLARAVLGGGDGVDCSALRFLTAAALEAMRKAQDAKEAESVEMEDQRMGRTNRRVAAGFLAPRKSTRTGGGRMLFRQAPPSPPANEVRGRKRGRNVFDPGFFLVLTILLTCSSHLQPLVLCLCGLRCTFPYSSVGTRPFPLLLVGRFKIR